MEGEIEELRARLRALVDQHGRKKLWMGAISEGTFCRILGAVKRPINNPGVFTLKGIAENVGMSLGELLGEKGFTVTPADRRRLREFGEWLTEKFSEEGREIAAGDTPRRRGPEDQTIESILRGELVGKDEETPEEEKTTGDDRDEKRD